MLADLPPSSSRTFLTVPAARAATRRPTSVEPVKATLSTSGAVTSGSPASGPNPGRTLTTPSGTPASVHSLASSHGRARGLLGRLEHHGVAGGQGRGQLPGGVLDGEVPGDDGGADPDRLAAQVVVAGAGGDGERQGQLGREPGRQLGVGPEGEHRPGDVGGPGLADGAARVADLQVDQAGGLLLELGRDRLEHRRPPLRLEARPAAVLEGGPGGGHGPLHVGLPGPGHGGVGPPGGRVEGLEGLPAGRVRRRRRR